jgi:hypothetical protein
VESGRPPGRNIARPKPPRAPHSAPASWAGRCCGPLGQGLHLQQPSTVQVNPNGPGRPLCNPPKAHWIREREASIPPSALWRGRSKRFAFVAESSPTLTATGRRAGLPIELHPKVADFNGGSKSQLRSIRGLPNSQKYPSTKHLPSSTYPMITHAAAPTQHCRRATRRPPMPQPPRATTRTD